MQTVNESIDLRSVLEKVGQLKAGIAGIAVSEQDLIKNRAERMTTVRREIMQRGEADEERMNRRLQELSEAYQGELDLAHAAAEARVELIHQAYHSSKGSLANRAQGVKDRRIGQVQGSIMRNRQARQEELARAKEEHAEFLTKLGGDRSARRELQKSVLKALRSYSPLIENRFSGKASDEQQGLKHSPAKLREDLAAALDEAADAVESANRLPLARLFRFVPLWLQLAVVVGVPLWLAFQPGGRGIEAALPSLGIWTGAAVALWLLGLVLSLPVIRKASSSLSTAAALEKAAEKESAARLGTLDEEIRNEQALEGQSLSDTFRESDSEWKIRVAEGQKKLDRQFAGLPAKAERLHQRKLGKIDAAHQARLTRARADAEERAKLTESSRDQLNKSIDSNVGAKITDLTGQWASEVLPIHGHLAELEARSLQQFPPWSSSTCEHWSAPDETPSAVRIGEIRLNAEQLSEGMPHDKRLSLPAGDEIPVPFALGFPDQGSILIESEGAGEATLALNSIALRLLAAHPPGRAAFVFIDPVGLGKDFAGLMHLADYEETLINHRIWTQGTQIEERLAELNEHIEKVIQMYLRNEYATIAEYNEQAGTIAEKSRFLVIAGFPSAFSETACKRLLSIASSGARCGVHLLIQRDIRQPVPDATLEDELRRACVRVSLQGGTFRLTDAPRGADVVVFDPPPSLDDSVTLVHRIGKASVDSNRVQVPFSHIAPSPEEMWQCITTDELRVPIGRTGAKKLQMLSIGKGTRQHALVAGKTGSGKSTLFHVIITNLALWCSPGEVEFYLVDFKKGVEFKCYAAKRLPHARVIAIESDREFALSVLQRIDAELKRRGELFRKAGSQDLASYKKTPGHEPMPRSLLLIDEFQEFFTEDDGVAQEASLLLDRIVRQGRAFGIHVILGSQTLGGAYTLARATLGQMVIRVALQCNEADAHLIMEDDNPAARMLTRPGEGIYNDQAGAL
ncbi:MAG: ATP-binding protein, partial [Verrucomicrobiaceae bacterium]